MKITRLVLALFGCLLVSGLAYGDQVLVNGGFETGSISPWTNDTRFAIGGETGWSIATTGCFDGSFCAIDTGNIGLKQTFSGVSTNSITDVSFFMNTLLAGAVVDFFYQGGTDQEFIIPPPGGISQSWVFFDATSDLLPNSTLVGFEVWGNGSSRPTLVDDVSITTTVPEPSSLLLLGSGLLGLVGTARRKRLA